jgi:hypothetical protein
LRNNSCCVVTAGRNGARAVYVNITACAAGARVAANGERNAEFQTAGHADGRTAIAAGTTNALRKNRVRPIAGRGDHSASALHFDSIANAAKAAASADANADKRAHGHSGSPIAAAASDTLREDRRRVIAAC